jgi:hypothetical protein
LIPHSINLKEGREVKMMKVKEKIHAAVDEMGARDLSSKGRGRWLVLIVIGPCAGDLARTKGQKRRRSERENVRGGKREEKKIRR